METNKTQDLETSRATFPKVSKDWDVTPFPSLIKMRRTLITTDKFCSAVQEIIIYEDKGKKIYASCLSTPCKIIEGKMDDVNVNVLHEVVHKNANINYVVLKSEILDSII